MRWILVDGHPATRRVFCDLIHEKLGDRVELVVMDLAADAAERVRRERFDLAIVDTLARVVALGEAVRMLVEARPDLPVMVMTASPDDEEITEAADAGSCIVWDKAEGEAGFWAAVVKCLPEMGKWLDRPEAAPRK